MATGDADDMAGRIRRVLPAGWFADETPVLDAVLAGFGAGLATVYALIAYAVLQTRLATVSDTWLDLAGLDYRGVEFQRRPGESDTDFRGRLLPILRTAATRPALEALLAQLTGQPFWVFEPSRPADVGGYGVARAYGQTVRRVPRFIGDHPYLGAGRYGSLSLPFQCFIHMRRPLTGDLTDADLYAEIVAILPIACTAWTCLEPDPANGPALTAPLDAFSLDGNVLA